MGHRHGRAVGVELLVTAALGVARGAAVRLSERDGYLYQRGGWPLVALWIVSIGIRVAPVVLLGGAAAAATTATLTLSLGVSLAVQSLVLAARVRADGRPLRPGGADRRAVSAGSRLGR
ncbi:hypothetical protein BJF78_25000 [Pseudonocardia sp. CNS-139]|nr:hypothetical protein BJF78_25000 [Pseudonocardia sp. CNS-139]